MTANIYEIPATVAVEIAGVIVDPNMGRVTARQVRWAKAKRAEAKRADDERAVRAALAAKKAKK